MAATYLIGAFNNGLRLFFGADYQIKDKCHPFCYCPRQQARHGDSVDQIGGDRTNLFHSTPGGMAPARPGSSTQWEVTYYARRGYEETPCLHASNHRTQSLQTRGHTVGERDGQCETKWLHRCTCCVLVSTHLYLRIFFSDLGGEGTTSVVPSPIEGISRG